MIEEIAALVKARRGQVVTVELAGAAVTPLLYELDIVLDNGSDGYDPDVCFVLGRSSRTREQAVAQFVAAMRLPYEASLGWDDFIYQLGEGPAAVRTCVVVADAGELLADDPAARRELLDHLPHGPSCLGGGWTTVVLANAPNATCPAPEPGNLILMARDTTEEQHDLAPSTTSSPSPARRPATRRRRGRPRPGGGPCVDRGSSRACYG